MVITLTLQEPLEILIGVPNGDIYLRSSETAGKMIFTR